MQKLHLLLTAFLMFLAHQTTLAAPLTLGNTSNLDGIHDTWHSNLVMNLTDTYTNTSDVQEEVVIGRFSFYAHQLKDPVTPFIAYLNLNNTEDSEMLAIGTTRTATEYQIGQNIFPFKDGTPKVIHLDPDTTIAIGFLDAHPDGSGGGQGSVIPFSVSGVEDSIWYVGGPSGEDSATISPFLPVKRKTTPLTNLTRNYHYYIDFDVMPAETIHISRAELITKESFAAAPGQELFTEVGLHPKGENVDLSKTYIVSQPELIQFTSNGGHYMLLRYVDDTPIKIISGSTFQPEFRIPVTVNPIPRAPYSGITIPSSPRFNSSSFDYGDEGTTFHDNSSVGPGILERNAVALRNSGSNSGGYDVTDIEAGEWLEYTLNVRVEGWYRVEIVYAGTSGGQMHLDIGGENKTGKIILPSTSSDQMYSSESVSLSYLQAGKHVMRAYFEKGGFHLHRFIIDTADPDAEATLGNDSDQAGILDTWGSNLVINKTDTYTNNSGGQQRILLDEFSFFAQRKADPVTPFVAIFYTNNTFTVLAIGNTRTATDYQLGNNTFAFSDQGPKAVYLGDGETLAAGFMDANPDGSGGGAGSVVPFDQNGTPDNLWYLGNPSGSQSASIYLYQELDNPDALDLSRNYHYNIPMRAANTTRIHPALIQTFNAKIYEMAPGEERLFSAVLFPIEADNLSVNFTSNRPSAITWPEPGSGHFVVTAYQGAAPITLTASGDEDSDMRVLATVIPKIRAPYTNIDVPASSMFRAVDFDYGDEGTTFHNNVLADTGKLQRNAVERRLSGATFGSQDVTNIENGEWLEYTINVVETDSYLIETHYAGNTQGRIHFDIDGANVSGAVTLPATASDSTYGVALASVGGLTQGEHILRVHFEQGGFHLNSFNIIKASSASP